MRRTVLGVLLAVIAFTVGYAYAEEAAPISQATQDCIFCHSSVSPSIVEDWKRSRHSRVTPGDAIKKPESERRVSAAKMPEKLTSTAVGCAECHTLNTPSHKDSFSHGDMQVHVLVTPKDCATCHPTEVAQFDKNLMSHARGNLINNKLYQTLTKSATGHQALKRQGLQTELSLPDEKTLEESCAHCHGTAVEVLGKKTRETEQGEMEFPVLTGWSNQGVGRFNPDGSKGSCTACHSRHQFAIHMARQPYTCAQ